MSVTTVQEALSHVNHSREKRMEMALLVSENTALIKPLLKMAFTIDDPISCKACWVLEFTAKENLAFIYPYLDEFTSKLSTVHLESAMRPLAKICEYLTTSYFRQHSIPTKNSLSDAHLEKITVACFDWLINPHKVATQAYAMTSLLLLGRKFKWILPELKLILTQNYADGSAAYKARARMTLAKIK
ncbi:hypothetical protein [Cellulophaga sp. Hel_I_12]|uniref:hypothetical protein n=1 Tax=Cellulophaga sp. Hel_I_12 TaxID=1249972 RepID=UPI0006481171|nr:hypothetical protein [Cellulophaga sp. Hel_I_12]